MIIIKLLHRHTFINVRHVIPFVLLGLVLFGGCSSKPYRDVPDLEARLQSAKSITLLPPKVDVYEVSTGGIDEKIDEWSKSGTENVTKALKEELEDTSGFYLKIVQPESLSVSASENLDETQALYEALNSSIALHMYGDEKERFSDRMDNFQYSLGSEVNDIVPQSDLLLLVRGVDFRASTGRGLVKAGLAVIGALFGYVSVPEGEPTLLSLSVVEAKTGDILWYNLLVRRGAADFREYKSSLSLVKKLFKKFPIPHIAKKSAQSDE